MTRWNDGVSYPIQSGHGCIGCSEQNFWDHGSFYDRITNIPQFGTNTTAETVGVAVIGAIGAGVAVHAAVSTGVHLKRRYENDKAVAKAAEEAAAAKVSAEALLKQPTATEKKDETSHASTPDKRN